MKKNKYDLTEITLKTSDVDSLDTGTFRIRVSPQWIEAARKHGDTKIPNVGQMYLIERRNADGEWEILPRVRKITFEAEVNQPATLTIVYYTITPTEIAKATDDSSN